MGERRADLALFWLALAVLLLVVALGTTAIGWAVWVAAIMLVRFLHAEQVGRGLALGALAMAAALLVSIRAVADIPPDYYAPLLLAGMAIFFAPFAVDRLLRGPTARLGFLATFILPTVAVLIETVFHRTRIPGSELSIALTQTGNLALLQTAAVTGGAGITFLVMWTASVVNWSWERGFHGHAGRAALTGIASVLAVVLLAGWVRVEIDAVRAPTLRAAVILPGADDNAGMRQLDSRFLERLVPPVAVEGGELTTPLALTDLTGALIERAEREAAAGARVIVLPAFPIELDWRQEAMFVDGLREMARERGVVVALSLDPPRGSRPAVHRSRFLMIDRDGSLAWEYVDGSARRGAVWRPGERLGIVPRLDTPFGRVAAAIAYDDTYAEILAEAAGFAPALVLDPAWDAEDLEPFYTSLATLAAVEGGYSLLRTGADGRVSAIDRYGRRTGTLAAGQALDPVLVAQVQSGHLATPALAWGRFVPTVAAFVLAVLLSAIVLPPLRRRAVGWNARRKERAVRRGAERRERRAARRAVRAAARAARVPPPPLAAPEGAPAAVDAAPAGSPATDVPPGPDAATLPTPAGQAGPDQSATGLPADVDPPAPDSPARAR